MGDEELKVKVRLDYSEAVKDFNKFEKQMKTNGLELDPVLNTEKSKKEINVFTQKLKTSLLSVALDFGKQMVKNTIELDGRMTKLAKISDAAGSRLEESFSKSVRTAKELGASVSDTIAATTNYSKLGYSMNQSEELARAAILYKNISDGIDVDTASKSLTSALQGFRMDADDALGVVDRLNEVADNFPTDSAGIGQALQKSASSFYAANTDLSKSIALIAGTNSTIQNPDAVGTMWETVSMRIRGATAELEQAGLETEGMVETTSQLRDLIKGTTGFDIMNNENQFKDIYEIVVGIGDEWKNLSNVEQTSLLNVLAGKSQGNTLDAAFNNIAVIKDAYKTAENSAGSAMNAQAEYEESIQYSLDRIGASTQEFAESFVNDGLLKGIIDFGNGVINVFTKINDSIGTLGTAGLIGGGIFGVKGGLDYRKYDITQILQGSDKSYCYG